MQTPLATAVALLFGASTALAQQPVLTVYTYDSFVSDWGPGPGIEPAFEDVCGCDLEFVSAGDGAALLARLKLEGAGTQADVVLGLDTNLTAEAAATGLFAPHGVTVPALDLPVAWEDAVFLPYDWGWFAFVYDKAVVETPPASFAELIDSDLSIVIQDPRSSTPGLGLLMWVKAVFGDDAGDAWARLSDRIVTVTSGWSEAYGMFLEGEADMVLSYTTSPAYHLIAEEDAGKAAALFNDGHYLQVEVAGRLAGSDQPELARQFLEFMLTDGFQAVLPETNWMYPAKIPQGGLPEGFGSLIAPETSLLFSADEAQALKAEALAEWLEALAR